jgi:hypothetical protein
MGGKVRDQITAFIIHDECSGRNTNDPIFASAAFSIGAFPVPPSFGPVVMPCLEVDQRAEPAICDNDYVAAFSPLATVGPAFGHEFLTSESDNSIAARPGFDLDNSLVDKAERLSGHGKFLSAGGGGIRADTAAELRNYAGG